MKEKEYRSLILKDLEKQLLESISISLHDLAVEIVRTGFRCSGCGRCCKFSTGDNSVLLTYFDIDNLKKSGNINAIEPTVAEEDMFLADTEGNVHTFGWRLKRKTNGECVFLSEAGCTIYPFRPLLCRTYPFYIAEGKLEISECVGQGRILPFYHAHRLANEVLQRYIIELRDTIMTYRHFKEGPLFLASQSASDYKLIVHDSRGKWILDDK
ncbi:YkgJ family cysteine cluster protein [Methanohalophilus sp. RSK]|uniref:YkgJ family cysteine cluster protein n=1 Tax=Methanohalophilus sp. RSK TaxID=2485783 RepID=UPI000F43C9B9|nr:YkgJ family cysteine cluster protein [Methanohalophilus sp. RSK]RNI14089.1 YkgJ family cysteine cluster protein [Methanohalophilus sp. RSK]